MKKNNLKASIMVAIAGVTAVVSTSNAVNINNGGLGQVLIYPYYTVNNGLNTLISVVNTTDEVKATKVRFLEGKNSREVLEFNLYLSPYDVWTAALVETTSAADFTAELGVGVGENFGGQDSARIITSDSSCTVPNISGQQFLPFAFSGDFEDQLSLDMTRAREGHIEIIEMGDVINDDADAATHIAGVPEDCNQLIANWTAPLGQWILDPEVNVLAPNGLGGLYGNASLIDVAEGIDFTYSADAFEGFLTERQHTPPGALFPNLATGNVSQSNVLYAGSPITTNWDSGSSAEAISASYMSQNIYADYSLDESINARTEWIVTFPTKTFYVDPLNSIGVVPVAPFTKIIGTDTFDPVLPACEEYIVEGLFDREETTPDDPPIFIPPPFPPGPPMDHVFCWSANVLEFDFEEVISGTTEILGSNNSTNVATPYRNGWVNIRFSGSQSTDNGTSNEDGVTHMYEGLPVTGFVVQKFTNSNAQPGLLAQYGATFKQKNLQVIIPLDQN